MDDIAARPESIDAVVAVALAVDVDVVAGIAAQQVIALAAGERFGAGGADHHIVADRRSAGQDQGAQVFDPVGGAAIQRDDLDAGIVVG